MHQHVCEGCGQPFKATQEVRRFCGRKCSNSRPERAQWATIFCEKCATPIVVKPRYVGRRRFCTPCYRANSGALAKLRGRPPVTLTCEQCKRPFTLLACFVNANGKPRRFCSKKCVGDSRVGKPSLRRLANSHSNGIGGWRPDLARYFRSRWEANYARYLKRTGHSFEYEPERFVVRLEDGTEHAYTPDFRVDGTHFVEVKGWLRPHRRDNDVIKAAQSQLPLPLYVIRQAQYRTLEREWSTKIKQWEGRGDPQPDRPKRTCPICGEPVTSIHRKTVFCSRQCCNSRYRKPA